MDTQPLLVLAVAGLAGLASPLGGALAAWRSPSTLIASLVLGLAGGVLIGTVTLEMVPEALDLGPLWLIAGAFAVGVMVVFAFDLYVHRGWIAGERAEQRRQVDRFYAAQPPRGDGATVLAAGTGLEEAIEGLAIGVGAAIDPGLAVIIAASIALDNISEGMSIGELLRDPERAASRGKVLAWTGGVGAVLFLAAVLGWFLLRGLPEPVLGLLLAVGAGGMLYLTVTELVPNAHQRHFQQSGALAAMGGFVAILVITELVA